MEKQSFGDRRRSETMLWIIVHNFTAIAGLIANNPQWVVPNELPRNWSIADIAAAANPPGDGRVYVLAWQIRQDNRPLRVESSLAVKVLGDEKKYIITHLFRHPDTKDSKWQESMLHATGGSAGPTGTWYYHTKLFEGRPGNKELYAALKSPEDLHWRWEPDPGWQLIGCGVCEASWQVITKEKPTRFFGK
jgi:hypothetical protein